MSVINLKYNGIIYSGEILKTNSKEKSKSIKIPNGNGKAVLQNGSIYIGQWVSGKIKGIGKLIVPKYSTYVGMFENGMMHGYGKLVFDDQAIISMEGTWCQNELQNSSCIIYNDGSKYIGNIAQRCFALRMLRTRNTFKFLKHGKGTYYSITGYIIISKWLYNNVDGLTTIQKDQNKFHCYFLNGKLNGKIKIEYADNTKYEGYCNSQFGPHGHGKMIYSDGSIYTGFWNNGEKDGYGFYLFANKDYYSGYWKNNKKHGTGIYYYKIGSFVIEYYWQHDQKISALRHYYY
jgi:hypothetical protein